MRTLRMSCVILALVMASGCKPVHDQSARPGLDRPLTLQQFADVASRQLGRDILEVPELRDAQKELAISVGDLSNKAEIPTADFAQIQRLINSKLLRGDFVQQQFVVVDDRQRVERQLNQSANSNAENGSPNAGHAGDHPSAPLFDPADTYLLRGEVTQENQPGRAAYLFSFTLTNMKRAAVAFEKSYRWIKR